MWGAQKTGSPTNAQNNTSTGDEPAAKAQPTKPKDSQNTNNTTSGKGQPSPPPKNHSPKKRPHPAKETAKKIVEAFETNVQ